MMIELQRLLLFWVAFPLCAAVESRTHRHLRSDYAVKTEDLPLLPGTHNLSDTTYSGLIRVRETAKTTASLFFWLFPAQENHGLPLQEKPLVIWLNGGPGSSSMIGNFYELGPIHFGERTQTPQDPVELVGNPWSWNKNFNVLFLDQPAGTGYSVVDPPYRGPFDRTKPSALPHSTAQRSYQAPLTQMTLADEIDDRDYRHGYVLNQDAVGKDFLSFVSTFYEIFPELRDVTLHLAGESYAGKYIPVIAHYISEHNSRHGRDAHIPLESLAIGNQWTDPYEQINVHGAQGLALGIFSVDQAHEVDRLAEKVRESLRAKDLIQALLLRNELWKHIDLFSGDINHYDVRQGNAGVERARMRSFLNSTKVSKLLHASCEHGFGTDEAVAYFLSWDIMNSTSFLFPSLLAKYRILLYQGNFDFRDGVMSNSAWLDKLYWEHSENWKKEQPKIWRIDYNAAVENLRKDTLAGTVQRYSNLSRVIVWNAGHFVPGPEGNPQAALQMIDRHINNFPLVQ